MHGRHHLLLLPALAICALLTGPAAANAAWPGTPGKVAFLDREAPGVPLKVFTPAAYGAGGTHVTVRTDTYNAPNSGKTPTSGLMSAPVWSPDGTRLAFAAQTDDPGLGGDATHQSIFVWDWRTKTTTRVTTPPDGLPGDPNTGTGHQVTDYSPAWSPDGNSVAFVRLVAAAENDALRPQLGGNIHIVSLTGGGGRRQVTAMYGEQEFLALSWGGDPEGQTHLVGRHGQTGGGGIRLLDVDPNSGATTTILNGIAAAAMTDFDVMPDGLSVAYKNAIDGAHLLGFDGTSKSLGTDVAPELRASPTGNGVLHIGYTTVPGYGTRAGLLERHMPDPSADRWAEDPKDRWINSKTLLTGAAGGATPGRSTWDVQPQTIPIINIPGFAGSTIKCGTDRLWAPDFFGNDDRLNAMQLAADGKTNAGCAGAGPTQDPNAPDAFVNEALTLPIYQAQDDFIEQIAPGERGWRFSWDWRKAPGESVARLDAFITHILDTDLARNQGLEKVTLYGHSYGGLLMREYTALHPERVQRVLTAGTPFWGAPKSLFFLNFGVENPLSGVKDLDTFLPNAEAKAWARTATGLYHLIPSDNFGQWLRVGPADADQAGVRNWYTTVGGVNGALIDQARAWHQTYDGFSTQNGFVENRAVISTGLMTINGVDVAPGPDANGDVSAIIRMGDGDVTVPARSASQGNLGTHSPLGDPVHVQATCRISHMDLGGDPKVTQPYTEYLLRGRTPRKTEGACKADGRTVRITKQQLNPSARSSRIAGVPTLREASDAGQLQLVEVPGSPIAVLDDHRPVDVDLGAGVSLEIGEYRDGQKVTTKTYTDVPGQARLTTTSGGALQITADGQQVPADGGQPGPGPDPTPDPGPAPAPAPASGAGPAPSGVAVSALAGPSAAAAGSAAARPATTARLSVIVRGRLRAILRRGLIVRLEGMAAGKAPVEAVSGGRVVAKGTARIAADGRATVTLRFTAAARRSLARKPRVKLTVGAGKVTGTVTLRR